MKLPKFLNPKSVKAVELSPLMGEVADTDGSSKPVAGGKLIDHKLFNQKIATLQLASVAVEKSPKPPASLQSGQCFGWLMHQGKFKGSWKKAWFVLEGNYLFQYKSDTAPSPKKAYFVSYVSAERSTAEELEEEKLPAEKYITRLEDSACSLRLQLYSPGITKVLSAPSEETLNKWLAALEASVKASTRPEALEAKDVAAKELKPLLVAQMCAEVDHYLAMMDNLRRMGLSGDANLRFDQDDPRKSANVAKSGKLKMLKEQMGVKVWQKFYFVLLGDTVYYYSSRKSKKITEEMKAGGGDDKDDDDDDHDDKEDVNDMPWKGCINLTFATFGECPPEISKKPRVFSLKTPLRTFYIKARHEVDAEDWMEQFSGAQRGIPADQRARKLKKFDVNDDPLAAIFQGNPMNAKAADIVTHPLGAHFAKEHLASIGADPALTSFVGALSAIEAYKKILLPEKKVKTAIKIVETYVKDNKLVSPELQLDLTEQVSEGNSFAGDAMFMGLETAVKSAYLPHFSAFQGSSHFKELVAYMGPKIFTVDGKDRPSEKVSISGQMIVGRSKKAEEEGINLPDDHKVSREHCRLDVGPLVVVCTDLGSSKGTRLDAKDGKKITEDIILPGQTLFIGGYQLTLGLDSSPAPSPGNTQGKQTALCAPPPPPLPRAPLLSCPLS